MPKIEEPPAGGNNNIEEPALKKPTVDQIIKQIEAGERFHLEQLKDILPEFHKKIALKLIEHNQESLILNRASYFSGLDEQVFFKMIEKRRYINELLKDLRSYKNVDLKRIAYKLIESDLDIYVTSHLDSLFRDLDKKDLAFKLIKTGACYHTLFKEFKFFDGVSHNEIAKEMIAAGRSYDLSWYLNKLNGLEKEIALKLIEDGHSSKVAEHIKSFKDLDKNVALKLIQNNQKSAIVKNLEIFSGLDNEVAWELVKGMFAAYDLEKILDKFDSLDKDFALKLIESGQIWYVVGHPERFKNFTLDKSIALKIIEAKRPEILLDNIARFRGLDKEVIIKMIEVGQSKKVLSNNFLIENVGFDKEIALKLIELGEIETLQNNISRFKDSLDKEVALKLIEAGKGGVVDNYYKSFTGLDADVAIKLIESHNAHWSIKEPGTFQGLVFDNDLALKLIENDNLRTFAELLPKFQGPLDQEIAYLLIERRMNETYIIAHFEKFQGLDHNKVALISIKNGNIALVVKNFELFKHLNNEVALKLLEHGVHSWDMPADFVSKNIESFGKITDDLLKLAQDLGVNGSEFVAIKDQQETFKNLSSEAKYEQAVKILSAGVWAGQVRANFEYLKNIIGLKKFFEFKSKHWGHSTHDLLLFVDSLKEKNVFSPEILSTLIKQAPNPFELHEMMNQFSPELFTKQQQSRKERNLHHIENYNFASYAEFKHQIDLIGLGSILPDNLSPELVEKILEMKAPGINIGLIERDVKSGLIIRQAENQDGLDEKALIQPLREEYEITPLNEIVKNALPSQELTRIIPVIGQLIKNEKISSIMGDFSIFDLIEWQDKDRKEKIKADFEPRLQAIQIDGSISEQEKIKAKIRLSNDRKVALNKSAILKEGGKFINLQNIKEESFNLNFDSPFRDFFLKLLKKKEYKKLYEFLEKHDLAIDKDSENKQVFALLLKLIDLGINGSQPAGQAKKLYNDLASFIKDKYQGKKIVSDYLAEEIPKEDQESVRNILKLNKYEIKGKKMVVQIHRKSDPKGWVAGDFTDCCMRYGTDINYEYMSHEDTAYFTVSVVDEYGQEDMIAQSVLVAAKLKADEIPNKKYLDKKRDFPVLAVDNIEIANRGIKYRPAIAKAYNNFFKKHFSDKLVILGTSYNDDGGLVTGELENPNMLYEPVRPLKYSDCFEHSSCYVLHDPENTKNKDGLHLLGLAIYNFSESPLLKKLNKAEIEEAQTILDKIGKGEDDEDGGLNFPDNHSNVFLEKNKDAKEVLGYILAADYLSKENEEDKVIVEVLKFFNNVPAAKQEETILHYLSLKKNIEMPIVFSEEKLPLKIVELFRSSKIGELGFAASESNGKIILQAK
ncbi:MAG: hypothetical protein NTZ49_01840 [Candidatus Parcubacteria bacterium]|nr:hypothetical protein [Candidatus Parcubacteria bacterium]